MNETLREELLNTLHPKTQHCVFTMEGIQLKTLTEREVFGSKIAKRHRGVIRARVLEVLNGRILCGIREMARDELKGPHTGWLYRASISSID